MSAAAPQSTKQLFRAWRSGDAEAGQAMAQRITDWYYAISTSHLGESGGEPALQQARSLFGQGVVEVTDARALVPWAHGLIATEIQNAGSRIADCDDPSFYTNGKRPKTLLVSARATCGPEMELLEACYSSATSDAQIDALAEPLGGNPLGILKARYRVKRFLRDTHGVPLEVAPEEPNLDRAPLPLYEAVRMANAAEETNFEHWMLTDLDLCRDIAEFAHFAIALRGGLPASAPATPSPTPAPATAAAEVDGGDKRGVSGIAVGAVVVVLGLLVLGALGLLGALLLFLNG